MKLQLTALAAAIALSSSMAAMATSIVSNTNLDDTVDWGVDNTDQPEDGTAWDSGFPPPGQNNFNFAKSALGGVPTSSAAADELISDVDVTGDNNQASVSQTGGGQESRVRQDGNLLKADVDQQGNGHYSGIDQELTSGGIVNVLQQGMDNSSEVEQYGGDDNGADIEQTGDDNTSFVRQGGIGGGASLSDATVVQSGNDNQSYIGQTHGDANQATATQAGDFGISYIIQQGSDNIATLDQLGGSGNESFIHQDNFFVGSASMNEAYVTQGGGDNNVSTITQVGVSNGWANVSQMGSNNQVSTIQY